MLYKNDCNIVGEAADEKTGPFVQYGWIKLVLILVSTIYLGMSVIIR